MKKNIKHAIVLVEALLVDWSSFTTTKTTILLLLSNYHNRTKSCWKTNYTVSQKNDTKNDTDVIHYRFNPHQPISVVFWQRCCWESMLLNG